MSALETTRRGVLWLGLKCDVRCEFCYDELVPSSQKAWVPLADVQLALNKFRFHYMNHFVDFMGGEPTLHPHVIDIVRHSAEIGLRPTLITHGMRFADLEFAAKIKEAGVHDVLMSVHGIGETVTLIHRRGEGTAHADRQLEGIANLKALGIPMRFNVTVVRENLEELPAIADLAVEHGIGVVNFLTFNPYFEWSDGEEIPFQVRHSEARPFISAAIDTLTDGGVEANVRYTPICQLPGYEQHVFTGHQLPYDCHEWDYNSWYDRGEPGRPSADWYADAAALQSERHSYVKPPTCADCAATSICDGLHAQYVSRFGESELRAINATDPITDPRHFISKQPHVRREADEPDPSFDAALAVPLPLTQFEHDLDNRAGVKVEFRPRKAVNDS